MKLECWLCQECVQKWGTYKIKSVEYHRRMCSAHRPQRPDDRFGHKCSSVLELSVPWSCGLQPTQAFSSRLTSCHQCQGHCCGHLPIGAVLRTRVPHRPLEHLGLITVHVSCLSDPWILDSSSPWPALSKFNTYLFLVS